MQTEAKWKLEVWRNTLGMFVRADNATGDDVASAEEEPHRDGGFIREETQTLHEHAERGRWWDTSHCRWKMLLSNVTFEIQELQSVYLSPCNQTDENGFHFITWDSLYQTSQSSVWSHKRFSTTLITYTVLLETYKQTLMCTIDALQL